MPRSRIDGIRNRNCEKACAIFLAALAVSSLFLGCADSASQNTLPPLSKDSKEVRAGSEIQEKVADSGNISPKEPADPREPKSVPLPGRAKGVPPKLTAPEPIFRPSDVRHQRDPAKLEARGIRTFESKRLRLHTDIDPKTAETLPRYIDAVYDAWVNYFGALPPNREGTEYQITGYIMQDRDLFAQLDLLPADLPPFLHGRHRGAEFWLHDQKFDYYRRHLIIHEATHCFMTAMPDVQAPAWYMEGMAELFGTHREEPNGRITFRVMPEDDENYGGLGRIGLVRADIAAGRLLMLRDLDRLRTDDFVDNSNYGWTWALCQFLDAHPRYRERFRTLSKYTTGTQFDSKLAELFRDDLADMNTEWILFAAGLDFGYDLERAAITFRDGVPFARPQRVEVEADRGWQSSGVLLEKGQMYDMIANGEFTLGKMPEPWLSGPDGVSIFYAEGRPIGRLLASIRASVAPDDVPSNAANRQAESMREVIPIGRHARFTAPTTGTLYFRINDFWSSLADNSGSVSVEVRNVTTTP